MGVINFHRQGNYLVRLKNILAKRGLTPDLNHIWEIHGPHQELPDEVLVGYADEVVSGKRFCVVVTPRQVYAIGEPVLWWNRTPSARIKIRQE